MGQAFDPSISADGTFEVFINPVIDNPVDVLAVLAHELGHVWAGIQCGHRGEFARFARAIGLSVLRRFAPNAENNSWNILSQGGHHEG